MVDSQTLNIASFHPLFSLPFDSSELYSFLSSLSPSSNLQRPEIKTYPDAIYHNYYLLGLSICFIPNKGLESIDIFNPPSSPPPPSSSRRGKKYEPTYSAPPELHFNFPSDTLTLPPPPQKDQSQSTSTPTTIKRPTSLTISKEKKGREFVSCLGEPSRKGAGGWTGVWLEWTNVELRSPSPPPLGDDKDGLGYGNGTGTVKLGIMLELRPPSIEVPDEQAKKKGMGGIWERAAGWEWSSIKVFKSN